MISGLAFFGAFNPPTRAHLDLARYALTETGGEQVIFVPSKAVYIRDDQGKDFAYTDEQRLAMLRAAAKKRPWMAVTDWEMRQERQPRTYETLCHLREEGWHAALLMGSDKLPELEYGWQHVREIAAEFGIVCMTRGKDNCLDIIRGSAFLQGLGIRVLETPEITRDVSSTRVRQLTREGQAAEKELAELVPEEILEILTRNGELIPGSVASE